MAAAAIPDIGLSRDGDSRQLTAPHVVDFAGPFAVLGQVQPQG